MLLKDLGGSAKAVLMATNFVNVDVVFAMKTAATSDRGTYDSSNTCIGSSWDIYQCTWF